MGESSAMSIGMTAERLAEVCRENKVPGAVLGVLRGGELETYTHGVTNLETGVEVTDDTVFQIGSITKVWTATLIMMLVDDGIIDLDVPIRQYLKDFRVADEQVSETVTVRHLLTHTSGIGGDNFVDTGRGDDCLQRYVEACADLGQDLEIGTTMSYSNTGYSILGRLIEVVTDKTWDEVLHDRLVGPMALDSVGTLPEEAIVHRAAAGHIAVGDADPKLSRRWGMSRSTGPAGLIHSNAADLLAFARMHMTGASASGASVPGEAPTILSAASTAAMQQQHVELADRWTLGTHWGLGWIIYTGAAPGYGHDGAVLGQYAFMRVIPEHDVAICLLTNGGTARRAWQTLFSEVARETAGVEVDLSPPEAPEIAPDLNLSSYEGRFERHNFRGDLTVDDGVVLLRLEDRATVDLLPIEARTATWTLTPVDKSLFIGRAEPTDPPTLVVFFDFDGETPRRFHAGARAMTRQDGKESVS